MSANIPLSTEIKILNFLEKLKQVKNAEQNFSEIFTDRVAAAVQVISPQVYATGLTVETISSVKDAITFKSDTIFFGRPYFTTDTAGFAKITKGQKSIDVTFDKEYLEQPVVNTNITLDNDPLLKDLDIETDAEQIEAIKNSQAQVIQALFDEDVRYLVVNKSVKGFTIILKDKAKQNISFSWIALAVKGAKTFTLIEPTIILPTEQNDHTNGVEEVINTEDTTPLEPIPEVITVPEVSEPEVVESVSEPETNIIEPITTDDRTLQKVVAPESPEIIKPEWLEPIPEQESAPDPVPIPPSDVSTL